MGRSVDLRMAVVHIHLHNLGTGTLACVAHFQSDPDRLISGGLLWSDFQIAVLERRIVQSKAKRELRLYTLAVVIAISNVNSLGVIYLEVFTGVVCGRR